MSRECRRTGKAIIVVFEYQPKDIGYCEERNSLFESWINVIFRQVSLTVLGHLVERKTNIFL
jgi:hypothetical protein